MVRVARRHELASEGKMGCPKAEPPKYPLDTESHIRSAASYYSRRDTVKCKGFWRRWCKAAKRVGLKTPTVKEKCRI